MNAAKNTLVFMALIVAFIASVLTNIDAWDEHKRALSHYASTKNIDLTNVNDIRCINARLHYEVERSVIKVEPEISCTTTEINRINEVGKDAINVSGMAVFILFLLFIYWSFRAAGDAIMEREKEEEQAKLSATSKTYEDS